MTVHLDGKLSIEDFVAVARGGAEVGLGSEVRSRVKDNRSTLEQVMSETDSPIYGVTTGFGDLVSEEIPPEERRQLQKNLIRSHSAGVGEPLPVEVVRGIITLRLNSLGRGYSGARLVVMERLVEMLNKNVIPYVPGKGSLGASGDLIPLAHVASVLIGEGEAYYEGEILPAKKALNRAGINEVRLHEKEGLALINGTQAMTSIAALGIAEVVKLLKYADIIGGMTAFILGGNFSQYDSRIYELRPHAGQSQVANNLRILTDYDPDSYRPRNVQDPYSIRCIPQVHGSVRDAHGHAKDLVKTEMNSVTDNPLIFNQSGVVISGGNFHGEPVALAADYLKIALTELGNISERRVNRLLHPKLNGELPAFLAENPGTNSGLMMAQYTSAALASENKTLASPATVDSIPVSGDQEDHVSMGMHGAGNLNQVIENVGEILAVEMIGACQAQEFKNRELTEPLERFYRFVRSEVPPVEQDRELTSLIEKGSVLVKDDRFLKRISDEFGIV